MKKERFGDLLSNHQQRERLRSLIYEAISKLDRIPNINHGGCIYVAYALVQYFRTLGVKDAHMKVIVEDHKSAPTWRTRWLRLLNFLHRKADTVFSSGHVYCYVDKIGAIDVNGIHQDLSAYAHSPACVTIGKAYVCIPSGEIDRYFQAAFSTDWNSDFNVSFYIPFIAKALKIKFPKIVRNKVKKEKHRNNLMLVSQCAITVNELKTANDLRVAKILKRPVFVGRIIDESQDIKRDRIHPVYFMKRGNKSCRVQVVYDSVGWHQCDDDLGEVLEIKLFDKENVTPLKLSMVGKKKSAKLYDTAIELLWQEKEFDDLLILRTDELIKLVNDRLIRLVGCWWVLTKTQVTLP